MNTFIPTEPPIRKINKMRISFGELSQRGMMSNLEFIGYNSWVLNEGLATIDDVIIITREEANKIGISDYEFDLKSKRFIMDYWWL